MEINGTIFLQILIFLSLLVWLSGFLFAPLIRLFDERDRRIHGAQEQAFDLDRLADEKAKSFEVAYEGAKNKAKKTLSELKHEQEKAHGLALAKAKTIARERLNKAEADLLIEESSTRQKLAQSSETIAVDMVNALLKPNA